MAERGSYRAVKVVLLDGPDYQDLGERPRHLFLVLKLSFGPSGIEVHYPEALAHELAAKTGMPLDAVKDSLDVLEGGGWIRRERNVTWIVGQLEHEPALEPTNANHRKSIQRHVAGLPRLAIVRAFIEAHPSYFEDAEGVTDGLPMASEGVSIAPAITEERRGSTEEGVTEPDSDESGGEPPKDDSIGEVFAPLIRQHCWLGNDPPPKTVENNPGWHMGRELTIARQLIERGDVKAADLARIIETHREALEVEPTRPTSLLMFNMKDRKQYLSVCQGHIDKTAGSAATMGEALRNLKLAS